jgi:DNA-binding response OmpR family regulator
MHVLVVEDEALLRRIIVRNVHLRGDRVSEARTVAWAFEVCTSDLPDVVVLDLNLPDGSGWDLLRRLRTRTPHLPAVVGISAVPPSSRHVAEFGLASFLAKPFPIDALLRAVERAAQGAPHHDPLDHRAL